MLTLLKELDDFVDPEMFNSYISNMVTSAPMSYCLACFHANLVQVNVYKIIITYFNYSSKITCNLLFI